VKLIAQSQLGVEQVDVSAHRVHRYRVVLVQHGVAERGELHVCGVRRRRHDLLPVRVCPVIADMPAKVGSHISANHNDLLFGLNRWKPVVGPRSA